MASREISIEQFRSIIREEAIKYKKRTMLEAEKKNLQEELKELMGEAYMEQGNVEEIFGLGKESRNIKAIVDAYKTNYATELAKMNQALKAGNAAVYKQISGALVANLSKVRQALVQQMGVQVNPNQLHKELMQVAEPMEPSMVGASLGQKLGHGASGSIQTRRAE